MYREGLPPLILVFLLSFAILVIATLLLDPALLSIIITVIAGLFILNLIKKFKRNKKAILVIIAIWGICFGTIRYTVPYIFNNVFECYQSTRIYSMMGKEYDCSKNVKSANLSVNKKAAKKFFKKSLSNKHVAKPTVINVDKAPAFVPAHGELQKSGEFNPDTKLRRVKYLNNSVENDHKFIKSKSRYRQWYQSFETAASAIQFVQSSGFVGSPNPRSSVMPSRIASQASLSVPFA
jgi:hypothetical protein